MKSIKYILAAMFMLSGCSALTGNNSATNSSSNPATTARSSYHAQSVDNDLIPDTDYPNKGLVRSNHGSINKSEALDYATILSRNKSSYDPQIEAFSVVDGDWLVSNIDEYKLSSFAPSERFYLVEMKGNFDFTYPARNKVVHNSYSRYRVLIRKKDAWLMGEKLYN